MNDFPTHKLESMQEYDFLYRQAQKEYPEPEVAMCDWCLESVTKEDCTFWEFPGQVVCCDCAEELGDDMEEKNDS